MLSYKVNSDFIIEKIDKKITIFDSEQSLLYTLNETASYILLEIKKGKAIGSIIHKMTIMYHVTKDKVQEDMSSIIKELEKNNILKPKS